MNNTDFFVNPLQTFHFLSILSSVNVLSNILNEEKLLTNDDRFKPIPLVNSLCEYLHKNNNSENAVILLGKKWIKNTHMYGSKENETISFQYVDVMIDHFIASVVFSKFANSFGYLSAIVNATNNLTLPFVKRKIALDLRKRTFLNQDYTNSSLTVISVKRITKKLIFPLFPEPGKGNNLRIVDVDYIYAQAGLMLARSLGINSVNNSFEEYIAMGQSVVQSVRRKELSEDVLQIFQLPSLLHYTYRKKKELNNLAFNISITSPKFWSKAFINLFSHLDDENEKIEELQKNNVFNDFEKALFLYKNRTEYAEYLLRRLCPFDSESEYAAEVVEYKFYHSDYNCQKYNFKMPNVNELFSQQNKHIAYRYFLVESKLLEEAFGDSLIEFIKQPNVAVWPIDIKRNRRSGFRSKTFRKNLKENIVLFQIEKNIANPVIYALIRENTTMTLLSAENDRDAFMQKIGLDTHIELAIPRYTNPLKSFEQDFEKFVTNLLEPKQKAFYNLLEREGYDPTTGESIIGFLKIFIPFYNCVENIKSGIVMNAVGACIVDSLVLIPILGQAASTGLKFAKAAITPLLLNFQTSMKSFTIGQFVRLSLNFGIRNFAVQASKELSKQITKELFKNIGVSILRTLDPGIELSYKLGKAGLTSIMKCFSIIGRKISSLSKVLKSVSKVRQPIISYVGEFKGHNLYVSSFSGKDGYGIKYFNFNGETVELRRIRGYKEEMPVVLVSNPKERKRIYQIKNLQTGELEATRWEVRNDILEVEVKPLGVRVKTIHVEGLSGRIRKMDPRIKILNRKFRLREKAIQKWKRHINEDVIREVMQNYVLDDGWIRTNVFDFYLFYAKMPEWSEAFKLTNVHDYEALRFSSHLEDVSLTEQQAKNIFYDLYRKKYRMEVYDCDPRQVYKFYTSAKLHSVLSFQDFIAISRYGINSPERVLVDSVEGWVLQNAFNKVSLRTIDIPHYNVPRTFFKLEKTTIENIKTFKLMEHRKFSTMRNLDTEISQSLQDVEESVSDGSSANVLYEIVLDNHYMVVDVQKILPSSKIEAVLLPDSTFLVEDARSVILDGKEIFKVTMKNTRVTKSEWAAKMNKNIATLNNRIETHNSILDDFDLSLLHSDSALPDLD